MLLEIASNLIQFLSQFPHICTGRSIVNQQTELEGTFTSISELLLSSYM